MGTYVHITNRRLTRNVELNGQTVKVDFAPFSHKPSRWHNDPPEIDSKMERAWNVPIDKHADYIVFGKAEEGYEVYKSNKEGIWSDGSGFWSGFHWEKDCVGILEKNGKKWNIKPK